MDYFRARGGLMRADFVGSIRLWGHTVNRAKFNAYTSYFWAVTRSHALEVGFFPVERI